MKKSQKLQQARELLNLGPTFTEKELKDVFRKKSLTGSHRHPDVGGEAEKFDQLRQAYNLLLGKIQPQVTTPPIPMTVDGWVLSTLGKGIQNGEDCRRCNKRGYLEIQTDTFRCPECSGTGMLIICPPCNARGTSNPKCKFCKGKGVISIKELRGAVPRNLLRRCGACNGAGRFKSSPTTQYHRCPDCIGHGQTPKSSFLEKAISLIFD